MVIPENFQPIIDAHSLFLQLRYEHWIHYEAYTMIWWLLLCLWILPWIVWFALIDRQRIIEIYSYGITIMFITTLLDTIGSVEGLWAYPLKIIPHMPELEPIDWAILPVTYMLIYQYFPRWKEFIIIHIILAALYSFVGEPFLINVLKIYLLLNWKSIYSFPIYLLLAIITRILIQYLFHMQKHEQKGKKENAR